MDNAQGSGINNTDGATPTGRERSNANLVPGRKSLSGESGKHSPVVNVRVSAETRDGLREVAGSDSVTKVAREALDGAQRYYIVWEQSFDGAGFEWGRLDKAMALHNAEEMFEQFKNTARSLRWRRLQIRRGSTQVIKEWAPA